MKNLAVFTFDQVFFNRETGLMFIPAMREKEERKKEKKAMDETQTSPFPFATASGDIWLGAVLTNDCHQ